MSQTTLAQYRQGEKKATSKSFANGPMIRGLSFSGGFTGHGFVTLNFLIWTIVGMLPPGIH